MFGVGLRNSPFGLYWVLEIKKKKAKTVKCGLHLFVKPNFEKN
jgi:hypothetical protein